MGTTNRAKELSERLEGLCEGLAISGDSPSKETILNYFNELNNYRQSEIDELTKSRDDWKFSTEEFRKRFLYKCDEKAELTKEVDKLKRLCNAANRDLKDKLFENDDLTKEVERLRKERESNLKEKMYFNRMKELVSKVAYDSEHYTKKSYEVLRRDAIGLLDEYNLTTH